MTFDTVADAIDRDPTIDEVDVPLPEHPARLNELLPVQDPAESGARPGVEALFLEQALGPALSKQRVVIAWGANGERT